jgi:hypothetical protein
VEKEGVRRKEGGRRKEGRRKEGGRRRMEEGEKEENQNVPQGNPQGRVS